MRKKAVVVVIVVLAVAAHLLLGSVAVWSVWQWLGATGVVAGVVLVALHVAGFRRLAARRTSKDATE